MPEIELFKTISSRLTLFPQQNKTAGGTDTSAALAQFTEQPPHLGQGWQGVIRKQL